MMKSLIATIVAAAVASPALAASSSSVANGGAVEVAQANPMTEGEIKKIDTAAGKITLKHGPIQKLEMPGMTMVFQMKDKALLNGLAVGDMVLFDVEKTGGAMTVTSIKKAE